MSNDNSWKILIKKIGGQMDTYTTLETVEVYDIKKDTWKEVKSMPEPLRDFGITSHQQNIYITGGQGVIGNALLIIKQKFLEK